MAKHKLNLLSRAEFADFDLHKKNEYLQNAAKRIAEAFGEEFVHLSKDALSRLRRFYMRRSFADLKLEEMGDDPLAQALQRLAHAIRADEIEKVIKHELPSRSHNVRAVPSDDAQLMFFVPNAHDAPVKDDVNLMDIAPFVLTKATREGIIRYELKDALITIEGGAEVGLATAYDYDIFINMVSYLAEQVRNYRIAEAKGLRPNIPPKTYRPAAAEILKFCRRELGGKQYIELEHALDRLQATRIKITNLGRDKTKRRETEAFPLIGRYKVVTRTANDKIDQVEIDIPNWVYEGVVQPSGKPSILTLNPDYFLIAKPIAKFLYRLARKAAGDGEAVYSVQEVHRRSGSRMPLRKFSQALEELVESAAADPLPDYDFSLEDRKTGLMLRMRHRSAKSERSLLRCGFEEV